MSTNKYISITHGKAPFWDTILFLSSYGTVIVEN